jgi:hypothetical protein
MANSRFKVAYTVGDLFVVVALAALGMALFNEFQQNAASARRFIQSIWLPGDGDRLIAAFQDGGVTGWNLADGSVDFNLAPSSLYNADAPVAVSPDGRAAARMMWYNPPPPETIAFELVVSDLHTAQDRLRRKMPALASMAFSPDGKRLAIDRPRDNSMVVIDIDNRSNDVVLTPLDSTGANSESSPWSCPILFSATGDELYRRGIMGELTKWNLATKTAVRRQLASGQYHLFVESPAGNQLAVAETQAGGNADATTVETLTADQLAPLARSKPMPQACALATVNQGKSLAVLLAGQGGLQILNAATLQVEKRFPVVVNARHMAARDTDRDPTIAIANDQTIYLLQQGSWRTFFSMEPSHRRTIWLLAIVAVCAFWPWLQFRRGRSLRFVRFNDERTAPIGAGRPSEPLE